MFLFLFCFSVSAGLLDWEIYKVCRYWRFKVNCVTIEALGIYRRMRMIIEIAEPVLLSSITYGRGHVSLSAGVLSPTKARVT